MKKQKSERKHRHDTVVLIPTLKGVKKLKERPKQRMGEPLRAALPPPIENLALYQ